MKKAKVFDSDGYGTVVVITHKKRHYAVCYCYIDLVGRDDITGEEIYGESHLVAVNASKSLKKLYGGTNLRRFEKVPTKDFKGDVKYARWILDNRKWDYIQHL